MQPLLERQKEVMQRVQSDIMWNEWSIIRPRCRGIVRRESSGSLIAGIGHGELEKRSGSFVLRKDLPDGSGDMLLVAQADLATVG